MLEDKTSEAGRHLVLCDEKGRHRLLISAPCFEESGYFIPYDRWVQTRLDAIQAFDRSFCSTRRANSGGKYYPSLNQRYRLSLMLRILDAIDDPSSGIETMREIAQNIIYHHTDLGRAIEWKSSSHRRHTQRLVNEAHHLMNGGYRLLLKGQAPRKTIDI